MRQTLILLIIAYLVLAAVFITREAQHVRQLDWAVRSLNQEIVRAGNAYERAFRRAEALQAWRDSVERQ
jgi:hypothetical protein